MFLRTLLWSALVLVCVFYSSIQVSEMRRTLTPSNSPMSSPSKHGDRFIPSRAGANWSINFHRINVSFAPLSCSSVLEVRKWCIWVRPAWSLCLSAAPWSSAAPEEVPWMLVFKQAAPVVLRCYLRCVLWSLYMVIACFSISGKWKITKSEQKSKGRYIRQWQRWDRLPLVPLL